jgi:hypothetical protein
MAEKLMESLQAADIGKLVNDTIELIKEKANLRTVVDLFMDTFTNIVPDSMLEQAMDLGKHLIDNLIYSIRF